MSKLAINGGNKIVTIPQKDGWDQVTEEEISIVTDMLRRGELSSAGGGVMAKFEQEFAEFMGAKYCLSQNSGTSTLHSAYFAAGIGPGDEVIVPSYTWHATATPVLHTNGIPVFCEIDPHSLTVDPDDLKKRITPRTKAIAVVHVFGYVANMDAIMEVANEHDLIVVEDCSHAHGAEWDGRKVGTIGHIGCFSLQASKPIIAGEGGAIITDDTEFYERILILGHYGRIARDLITDKYKHLGNMGIGWKYRAHPLAVGIAKVQLARLNELNEKRGKIAQYWDEEFSKLPGIEPVYTYPKAKRGGYLGYLLIYHAEKLGELPQEKFMAALQAEGVSATEGFYKGDLHLQSLFNGFNFYGDRGCPFGCPHIDKVRKYEKGSLPVSESIGPKVFSLPVFTEPTNGLVEQYVDAFRKVVENIGEIQ